MLCAADPIGLEIKEDSGPHDWATVTLDGAQPKVGAGEPQRLATECVLTLCSKLADS